MSSYISYCGVIVCSVIVQEISLLKDELFFIENLEMSLLVNDLYISTDAIVLLLNSHLIATSSTLVFSLSLFVSLFLPFYIPFFHFTSSLSF